jgi:hypothetical protein
MSAASTFLIWLPSSRTRGRDADGGTRWPGCVPSASGSRSFAAIGQWVADAGAGVLAGLGAVRGPAEESTFRRAFALISADVSGQVIGAWLHTRAMQAGGRLVIAVDGKAVRGARNGEEKPPHLVAALAHGIGAVLGQVAVDAKSNEIPAVRELLKAFTDLAGAVITVGALHTPGRHRAGHHRPARRLRDDRPGRHADLYKQLKKLPWTAIPATSAVSTGHGRRARRDQGRAGAGLDRVRRRRAGDQDAQPRSWRVTW